MKKIVLIYGSIAGLIVAGMMMFTAGVWCAKGDFSSGMIYGYTSMIIAFSMIFVATKSYRDKYNGGIISFGKAFKVGMWITLIASTFYVVGWLIDYYFIIPDFMVKYTAHMVEQINAGSAGAADKAKEIAQANSLAEMYKNPIVVILFTYLEILPIGLVVALISAWALKRKKVKEQAAY